MGTISKTLQALIDAEKGDRQVPVHVMLDAGVSQDEIATLLSEIRGRLADPASLDYLRHMRIVLGTASLDAVEAINGLAGVVSIDLDSAAPLEELIDAEG